MSLFEESFEFQQEMPLVSLLFAAIHPVHTERWFSRVSIWQQQLDALGVHIPLNIVHDFGLLCVAGPNEFLIEAKPTIYGLLKKDPEWLDAYKNYIQIFNELAQNKTIVAIRALQPSDTLVVALISHLLVSSTSVEFAPAVEFKTVELSKVENKLEIILQKFHSNSQKLLECSELKNYVLRFNQRFLSLLIKLDTLSIETLKLFSLLHGSRNERFNQASYAQSALAPIDVLAALNAPHTDDTVRFSLEILPAVLEASRLKALSVHPIGGYQGLTKRGSLDSLVLSELAWSEEEIAQRLLENEALFYAREQHEQKTQNVHLILLDASASMRGTRAAFARGIAIALAKRLDLEGEDFVIRFFDRQIYFDVLIQSSKLNSFSSTLWGAYILTFQGEQGRNPERVCEQLIHELEFLRRQRPISLTVHLITHAAFYAARAQIAALKEQATLYATFVTSKSINRDPKNPYELDYLDLLNGYWFVNESAFEHQESRIAHGQHIVFEQTKLR